MTDPQAVPAEPAAARNPRLVPLEADRRFGAPLGVRRLFSLFDSVQDFVVLISPTGRLIQANRSWCEMLGFEPSSVPGLPLSAAVPPAELGRWGPWLDPTRLPGEPRALNVTWRAKDGRDIAVEGTVRICPDDDGAVCVLGIFRNHLRLAATEAALRESAAVCHVIETRAPIGVFQTDCSGRLIRTNKRWRLIANLNHVSEPHGVWWQMVDPADRERVLAGWRATQQHGHDFRSEFRVQAAAGVERYARTTVVQNHAADGSPAFFLGVSEDITERRRFEAELKEAHDELEDRVKLRTAQLETANRELAQFAHVVAHDLKAPLRAVTNIAEWLWRDYEEKLGAPGYRFLSLLKQRARHMHDLIEGILAYTRFGPLAEAEAEVDLRELITQIIALLAPPPDITIRLPEALPRVPGVPERLRHIFQNLLDNAVKFMDKPHGLITLTATRLADAWEFAVSDNGPGIPPRYHARVFKMFEQLPGRRKTSGTGIGLALVKRIVESRHGEIRLDSDEGAGATFTFTWPDTPPVPVPARSEASPEI